jgi:orotate phosphoribosyltransferase
LLTSGRKSDYYFDCKPTALYPEGAYALGHLFCDMLDGLGVVGVGGMTLGADPLVCAVTVVSYTRGKPLSGFIVRKQAKGHGTNQYLEGLENFRPGDKVAMLEDVVTTGGTLLKACERVRQAGLEIAAVLAVLDREEGGRENLAQAGYELRSIFTRSELKAAGAAA